MRGDTAADSCAEGPRGGLFVLVDALLLVLVVVVAATVVGTPLTGVAVAVMTPAAGVDDAGN